MIRIGRRTEDLPEPMNIYDWRSDRPSFSEVSDNELIKALNLMQTNTLQLMHKLLHDHEGGGYIGAQADKETLHDAIALILDHRGAQHSPPRTPFSPTRESPPDVSFDILRGVNL